MTNDEKEIKRNFRILKHAEHSGNVGPDTTIELYAK